MSLTTVRQSRKNHKLPIQTSGGEHKDSVGSPKVSIEKGYFDIPKKYRPFETTTGQYTKKTKPPMSAEEPVRGEHGKVSNTSRKD